MTLAVDADRGHHELRFRHVSASDLGRFGERRLRIRHKRRRDGPLAVARAIPRDHARARTQHGWLDDVGQHPKFVLRRADAQANILAIARVLAAYASWHEVWRPTWQAMLTRPTWAVLMERTGLGRSTLAAHLAWMQSVGLLGLVAHGTTPEFSPDILRSPDGDDERNEAAVYVLIAPRRLRLVAVANPEDVGAEYVDDGRDVPVDLITGEVLEPQDDEEDQAAGDQENVISFRREEAVDTTRTPTPPGGGKFTPPRARARETPSGAGLRPALNTPLPMCRATNQHIPDAPPWPLTSTPAGRKDRLAAAQALQAALPLLGRISTAHVAHLAREWFLAGWTPADVVSALGRRPAGTPWRHSDGIRHVPGWFRHRLAAWRHDPADPTTPPGRSPGELARAAAAHDRAVARARWERAAAEEASRVQDEADVRRLADAVRAAHRAGRGQSNAGPGDQGLQAP